jgi:mRNA interferase MazF
VSGWVPEKGDFITTGFDQEAELESEGCRSALVVSNTLFNSRTGLAIVCPVTGSDREFPFHVRIDDDPNISGFVMVEQVRPVSFSARNSRRISSASDAVLDEVLALLDACIY